jgi:peptidoglycan/xylan/chitin deacetylase (PgdA/CDA1 family)
VGLSDLTMIMLLIILLVISVVLYATTMVDVGNNINASGETTTTSTTIAAGEKGIVVFYADDVWGGWIEDISQDLVELHIEKNVDLTIGVVPRGMDNTEMTDSMLHMLQDWYANHSDVIEIAQQGYNHSWEDCTPEYLKKGKDLFNSWGIYHYSWAPPYGNVEWNTTLYLEELGFHTIVDSDYLPTRNDTAVLIVGDGIWTDKEPLISGDLKPAEDLMKEADEFIEEKGFAVISYYIHDFIIEDTEELYEEKFDQFASLLDAFKSNGYRFMTAEELYQSL